MSSTTSNKIVAAAVVAGSSVSEIQAIRVAQKLGVRHNEVISPETHTKVQSLDIDPMAAVEMNKSNNQEENKTNQEAKRAAEAENKRKEEEAKAYGNMKGKEHMKHFHYFTENENEYTLISEEKLENFLDRNKFTKDVYVMMKMEEGKTYMENADYYFKREQNKFKRMDSKDAKNLSRRRSHEDVYMKVFAVGDKVRIRANAIPNQYVAGLHGWNSQVGTIKKVYAPNSQVNRLKTFIGTLYDVVIDEQRDQGKTGMMNGLITEQLKTYDRDAEEKQKKEIIKAIKKEKYQNVDDYLEARYRKKQMEDLELHQVKEMQQALPLIVDIESKFGKKQDDQQLWKTFKGYLKIHYDRREELTAFKINELEAIKNGQTIPDVVKCIVEIRATMKKIETHHGEKIKLIESFGRRIYTSVPSLEEWDSKYLKNFYVWLAALAKIDKNMIDTARKDGWMSNFDAHWMSKLDTFEKHCFDNLHQWLCDYGEFKTFLQANHSETMQKALEIVKANYVYPGRNFPTLRSILELCVEIKGDWEKSVNYHHILVECEIDYTLKNNPSSWEGVCKFNSEHTAKMFRQGQKLLLAGLTYYEKKKESPDSDWNKLQVLLADPSKDFCGSESGKLVTNILVQSPDFKDWPVVQNNASFKHPLVLIHILKILKALFKELGQKEAAAKKAAEEQKQAAKEAAAKKAAEEQKKAESGTDC